MLTSPFAFLRGAAAVMISDIASAPVTGLTVQACGDMHVSNFGVFASAERNLIFGINDFDETLPGAWEWDVKRLVASAVVCGRFLGFDKTDCEAAASERRQGLSRAHARVREDGLSRALVLEDGRARRARRRLAARAQARQEGHRQGTRPHAHAGLRQDHGSGRRAGADPRGWVAHHA
jgi:uncharacterized protein (DUF2252 family)